METKTFYRVSNPMTDQGLWYDYSGNFTGLIHGRYNFCKNKDLLMDFDTSIRGYLSVVESIESLYNWFTREDILNLQDHGYYVHEYQATDYRFYERFQHYIINQETSRLVRRITLTYDEGI